MRQLGRIQTKGAIEVKSFYALILVVALLLVVVSFGLPSLSEQVLPQQAVNASGEPTSAIDLLFGELRTTAAAVAVMRVEKIRHRGVYYRNKEKPETPAAQDKDAAVVEFLRPMDMPDPENESWAIHSHYNGLLSHIHNFGAKKHRHNNIVNDTHEHPTLRIIHEHLHDPDIPHWHEEGNWRKLVSHRHGELEHTHRMGIWPHTHSDMNGKDFSLINEEDKELQRAMKEKMSTVGDMANPFSQISLNTWDSTHGNQDAQEEDAPGGLDRVEEHVCEHGETLIPTKEDDWRGIFGTLEREIMPYKREHQHADATAEMATLPWYRVSVVLDPHFINGWVMGAATLRREYGKAEAAIAFLEEGLEKNPGDPELLLILGRCLLFGVNDSEKSLACFTGGIQSAKERLSAEMERGSVERGRWQSALQDCYRHASIAYVRLGRAEEARKWLEEGLARFPDDAVMLQDLDRLKLKAAKPKR
jgi:hypothetical protein